MSNLRNIGILCGIVARVAPVDMMEISVICVAPDNMIMKKLLRHKKILNKLRTKN
jgi:hypothetical protein